jgi:hypothetical protein
MNDSNQSFVTSVPGLTAYRPLKRPEDEKPLLTEAQQANIGAGFVPGMGISDILGLYPEFPPPDTTVQEMLTGPRAPSLIENVKEGDLGIAGLQLLGGLGDLIPLAGPALSAPLLAARAARKGKGIEGLEVEIGDFDPRFDPRVKEQERLRSTVAEILPNPNVDPKTPLRLSDLEGEDFITSMSDRTAAGGSVQSINEVPLFNKIDLRGGQDFMFENPNQVWASAKEPSEAIMRLAKQAKEETGRNPLYIPWRMAPTGGDFSTTTGELMIGFASSNMNKTNKKRLDSKIKNFKTVGSMVGGKRVGKGLKVKEWFGVDDPRSVEVWRNSPDSLRKELLNMMDVNFRDKGGLSIGAARLINSDPSQYLARDAGIQNVGRIFADQEVLPSTHPSYPFAVPGGGVGVLDKAQEATIFDLLPDARFGSAQKPVGDVANPTAQEIRALQMKPYKGRITETILRRMADRGVDVNSLAGLSTGAIIFTLTSAGLLTGEEAQAGGLEEFLDVIEDAQEDKESDGIMKLQKKSDGGEVEDMDSGVMSLTREDFKQGGQKVMSKILGISDSELEWAQSQRDRYPEKEALHGEGDAAAHLALGYITQDSPLQQLGISIREFGQDRRESRMDRFNNRLGSEIEADNFADAEKEIDRLIESGKAKFLDVDRFQTMPDPETMGIMSIK